MKNAFLPLSSGADYLQMERPTGHAEQNASGGLADLEGVRGSFTGAAVDFHLPCNAAEGDRTCQIVGQFSTWNEFLCKAHLELRELPGRCSQLSLSQCPGSWDFKTTEEECHQGVTVAYWLLKTHHCVTAIHIPYPLLNHADYTNLLSRALQGSLSVKSHFPLAYLWIAEKPLLGPSLFDAAGTVRKHWCTVRASVGTEGGSYASAPNDNVADVPPNSEIALERTGAQISRCTCSKLHARGARSQRYRQRGSVPSYEASVSRLRKRLPLRII